MSALSTYLVAFRQSHQQVRVLAPALAAKPNRRSLDPFVSRLMRDGVTGVVLLIERETGTVVARQKVA